MKQKKLSLKKIIILIAASLAMAFITALIFHKLGFDGGGSDSDMSWWNMINAMF